jgi:competence ComEA-like helix-hairpin-helix protein
MKPRTAILFLAAAALAAVAFANADPAWLDVDDDPPTTVINPPTINANTATMEELQAIPGIGPVLASRIVAARPFQSVEDIDKVAGIGASLMATIRVKVFVELPQAPETPWRRFEILHEDGTVEKIAVREVTQ